MPDNYEIQGISIDKADNGGFVVCCSKYYPRAKKSMGYWDEDKFTFQKDEEEQAWAKVKALYEEKWRYEDKMKKKYGK